MSTKPVLATTSLCGCFGCHMSLLDIDERIIQLAELVEFNRTPLTDIKDLQACDIGLIEGGIANAENVETIRLFREKCRILVAVGACAITGGIPAMRNSLSVDACLAESYLDGVGLENSLIPSDPEIPALLDKVYPLHEIVKIDYSVPGCPPSADALWTFLGELLSGQPVSFPYTQIHYD